MTVRAAWWLGLATLTLSARAQADRVSWPECPQDNNQRTVQRGTLHLDAKLLFLQNCNITSIEPGSFSNLPNLAHLRLGWNYITQLDSNLLKPLTKLKTIFINRNKLKGKTLPHNLFHNNRKLEQINFSHNDMNDAPFDLLQGLGDLKSLNMYNCSLLRVPLLVTQPVLKKLHHLDLSYNRIETIVDLDTFTRIASLNSLDLMSNQINDLHEDIFKPLTLLDRVILRKNKLSYLPEKLFKHHQFLQFIDLEDNLIEYIPANAFFDTNITSLNLSKNKLTFLPDDLYSAFTLNASTFFKFLQNPWRCACLNNILVQLKRHGIAYDNATLDGKHKVCVIFDYPCNKIFRIAIP